MCVINKSFFRLVSWLRADKAGWIGLFGESYKTTSLSIIPNHFTMLVKMAQQKAQNRRCLKGSHHTNNRIYDASLGAGIADVIVLLICKTTHAKLAFMSIVKSNELTFPCGCRGRNERYFFLITMRVKFETSTNVISAVKYDGIEIIKEFVIKFFVKYCDFGVSVHKIENSFGNYHLRLTKVFLFKKRLAR